MRITNPWVSFVILPVFGLANAGITFTGDALGGAAVSLVSWGVLIGLAIGKPTGIVLAAWLATRTNAAQMPTDVDWRGLTGLSCLAGIGFTVSLFIAELAFPGQKELDQAKIAIFAATVVAAATGVAVLWRRPRRPPSE